MIGRDVELAALERRLDALGEALVVRGDAGIGKSVLLSAARASAVRRGMTVLTTAGAESEAELPFAGLHQLLLPLLHDARVPDALAAAFGLTDAPAPDLYRIALATLELVGAAAAAAPLLVTVDDVHWLDRPTADVLAFLARRIAAEPVVVLFAARTGEEGRLRSLDTLAVDPLDAVASAALLDATAPGLVVSVRARLLAEAAGNPLALVELPRVDVSALEPLPLNDRLERAFAGQVSQLSSQTRALLLLAAAEPSCSLPMLLEATRPASIDVVGPAVAARLVELDGAALRFRHPLIASAVYRSAPLLERQAAHAVLAGLLDADADRRAWHRAAAALGTDDGVSAELSDAADRARRRGATMASVAMLERAAALTTVDEHRYDLLLRAAEQACELGRTATATRLVGHAEGQPLGPVQRGRLLAIRDLVDPGEVLDAGRIAALVDAADDVATLDTELALALLWRAASRCWWGGAPASQRRPVVAAVERLPVAADDVALLAILAYTAPIEHGNAVLDRMATVEPDRGDAEAMRYLGSAALILGDFSASGFWWEQAAQLYRERGLLGLLSRILISGSYTRCWTGEWDEVAANIAEGRTLAADTGDRFWLAAADATDAKLMGMRGDHEAAEALAARALANPLARGVRFVLFTAQQARSFAAMSAGRDEESYLLLRRVFDPADPLFHRDMRFWVLGDLAEAAVRAGHGDEARAIIAPLAIEAARTRSPRTQLGLGFAGALLADDEAGFRALLASDLSGWPFDRARIQLAFGAWLRRHRRYVDSRVPLRSAAAGFDALGARSYAERARAELAASGEQRRTREPHVRDALTPQELQIATLAARGLTNRQIGQSLYLSHRTVSSHLYRIFPKLDVGSRAELAEALAVGSVPTYATASRAT
jgi:DNA-binding CsgD family transcriptional regulator